MMDETDFSTLPTPATPPPVSSTSMDIATVKRNSRVFCCGDPLNVKSLLSRPGGAVQIVASSVATSLVGRRIDAPDEVGGSSNNSAKRASITANGTSSLTSNNASTTQQSSPPQCTLSTIQLSPPRSATTSQLVADRGRVQFLADNHLEELSADRKVVSKGTAVSSCSGEEDEDEVSAESMPSTSDRTQDDLIQFVFTSHGIRVISDKEYVV